MSKFENLSPGNRESFYSWIEAAPVPIMLYDENGEIIKVSCVWTDITGYTNKEIPTIAAWIDRVIVDRKDEAAASFRTLFQLRSRQYDGEFAIVSKDGRKHFWDSYSAYIGQLHDKRKVVMTAGIDITEHKEIETRLSQEKSFLETTLVSVAEGVISTNKDGEILFMNSMAEIMTGWPQKDARNRPVEDVFYLVNEYSKMKNENIVDDIIKSRKPVEMGSHLLLVSKDGRETPIEDSASPIIDKAGQVIGAVFVFRDYTEKRQKENEIKYLSYYDQLTGLYNRRYYEEELKRLDTPRNYPLALVMADVNGLKLVNDAFGHRAGDDLLKRISGILIHECRADDILARIGGDEFVILLPQTGAAQASRLISRIHDGIAAQKADKVILSVSIGFAVKENNSVQMNDVFRMAEDDMYRHKLSDSASIKSQTIDLILNSLYAKNRREMKHSQRVGLLCQEIASELHLSKDEVNQMRTAGLMHDIGKIGIDEKILNKHQKLDDAEWHEIMKHPEIGYRILSSVNEFSEIAVFVLQHQERWDGNGYPKGLKGPEISLQARIIGIADAYDAMTSKRTYMSALTHEKATEEIKEYAGLQFDPEVARIFIEKVLGENW